MNIIKVIVFLITTFFGISELPVDFATIGSIILLMMVLEEGIDRLWWDLNGLPAQIRALTIAVVVSTAAAFFKLGMFGDLISWCECNLWYVCGPVTGLAAGLIGALGFKLEVVKAILELFAIRPKWGDKLGTPKPEIG